MIRRIFGPKKRKLGRRLRKLHYEQFHNFYSSPGIITVIKSRRMRWTRHVAHIGDTRNAYNTMARKPEEK
jgi:hypothetical protein